MIKAIPTGASPTQAKRTAAVPVLPNCVAWYKYNEGITITGSGVSRWADASGNGNHLLQGTDAARPALQSDGSILFDGAAHFLKTAVFTYNQPATMYFLARQISWTAGDRIMEGSGGAALYSQPTTPSLRLFPGTTQIDNANWVIDGYAVITAIFNDTSSLLQINNGTAVTGGAGTSAVAGIALGATNAGTLFSNIQAKELICYTGSHDASTRTQMIGYLARLGGISI